MLFGSGGLQPAAGRREIPHLLAVLADNAGGSPRPQLLPAEDAAVHPVPQHAPAHVLQPGHESPGRKGTGTVGKGTTRPGCGSPAPKGQLLPLVQPLLFLVLVPAEPLLFQLQERNRGKRHTPGDTSEYYIPLQLLYCMTVNFH